MIPFKIKLLTETAKPPHRNCESDLWDLYADDFCGEKLKDIHYKEEAMYNYDITHKQNLNFEDHLDCFDRNHLPDGLPNECKLYSQGRILVKTGIAIELPIHTESEIRKQYIDEYGKEGIGEINIYDQGWQFNIRENDNIIKYAVADIRPRSDALEQKGLFIENKIITGGEVSFVAINHGHEPITISKKDVIAKMLICSAYPSKMEVVDI